MARETLDIQSSILIWARERRGYDIETAAAKLGLSTARLVDLESGRDMPTAPKLRDLADEYRVSPAVFFLEEVPEQGFIAPNDFRRLSDGEERTFSPSLREAIDRVRAQMHYLHELADMGVIDARSIDFELKVSEPVEKAAKRIRGWLAGDTHTVPARRDAKKLLGEWITLIESKGILISQVSGIPINEMRGFCLPNPSFPMIVLNGGDSDAPRLFTLAHELAHLLLGEDSICNDPVSPNSHEVFCNAVAAAVLIPRFELLGLPQVTVATADHPWTLDELAELASRFGVSREAILRRLATLGKASDRHYNAIRLELGKHYANRPKREQGGSGPRDAVIIRNLGATYVRSVLEARNRGLLSDSSVADFFFERIRWIDPMADRLGLSRP